MSIIYLTGEELLIIHALVVDETGGVHGVRDAHLLQSILHRPQSQFGGRDVHEGVFAKATAFAEALVNYHVFVDGNKRTAFAALGRFLDLNGYRLVATQGEVEKTMISVADKSMSEDAFREWIESHAHDNR